MKKIFFAFFQLLLLWIFFLSIFLLIKRFISGNPTLIFGFIGGFLFLILGIQGIYSTKRKLKSDNLGAEAKERFKKQLEVNWHLFWGGLVIILVAIYYIATH